MSFILDALKKSETERRRQTIPGLMDASPVTPRNSLPVWAMALGALLIANLLLVSWLWLRGGAAPVAAGAAAAPPSAPPATSTPQAAPPGTRTGAVAEHFSPLDTAPVYAPEIPVPRKTTADPVPVETAAPPRRRDPVLNDGDYKAGDAEVLPTMSELNLTGADALPDLHLDVHVYATRPADRFVFINMHQYHEGATLEEGPLVERIRRDGVILEYHSLRFLLPRQ